MSSNNECNKIGFKIVCSECGSDGVEVEGYHGTYKNQDDGNGYALDELRHSYWSKIICTSCGNVHEFKS